MGLAILKSRAALGIAAPLVTVEVHVAGGLPGLTIVGLPDAAVREAKDRVRAALQNSGFSIPPRRITVNLAPADLPKDGARFDLAIALGILQASDQLRGEPGEHEWLGELSLSGELRPVHGVLPTVLAARRDGAKLCIPGTNAQEAAVMATANIWQAQSLLEVCAVLAGQQKPAPIEPMAPSTGPSDALDLADVYGQWQAKRALEIAAAGRHNLLFSGPPGSGKSMLAQRLPSISPPMSEAQALELASIQSASWAGFQASTWGQTPFRAPHHLTSAAALAGGGSIPRPGEISLAHGGVLFLDEFPEFRREALEILREPMETGEIRIARVRGQVTFPSRFQLIAAMNPCPCGYLGDVSGRCRCTLEQVQRYRGRLSGPLLDRIDMQVHVPRMAADTLLNSSGPKSEGSEAVRERVIRARERQWARCRRSNAEMTPSELQATCRLDTTAQSLLITAANQLQLSSRATHRILRVARTIADLAEAERIDAQHLAEALQLRQMPTG